MPGEQSEPGSLRTPASLAECWEAFPSNAPRPPARETARGSILRNLRRFPLTSDFAQCEDSFVRIISRKAIIQATAKHSEWGASLNAWYKITRNADWTNFADVRNSWKHSDIVGRFVVFDISHNRCRLITTIKFRWRMVYIRFILDHTEYDEKELKKL